MKVVSKKLTLRQCRALYQSIQSLNNVRGNKCELIMAMHFLRKIFDRIRVVCSTMKLSYTLSLTVEECAAFYVCFHELEISEEDWGSILACEICLEIAKALDIQPISATHQVLDIDQPNHIQDDTDKRTETRETGVQSRIIEHRG